MKKRIVSKYIAIITMMFVLVLVSFDISYSEEPTQEQFKEECKMAGGAYSESGPGEYGCDWKDTGASITCDNEMCFYAEAPPKGGRGKRLVSQSGLSDSQKLFRLQKQRQRRIGGKGIMIPTKKAQSGRTSGIIDERPMKQPPVKPGVKSPSRAITKPKARPNRGVGTSPLTRGQSRACTDPAVRSIDFRIVNKTSRFKGRVEITGTIKNIGRAAYETRPNQQSMHLFEGTRLVKTQAFGNLLPGRTATIRYQRNWNSSSPAEGEFPPTYKLMIIYDPDITKDGNPKNDDCVGTNNRKERSGAGINGLFR